MEKKIGILTFHASHNNGSMLQAFALQNVLTEKFYLNAEIINFSNLAQQEMYSVLPKIKSLKSFVKFLLLLPMYSSMKKHYLQYESFMNELLKLSGPKFDEHNISKELLNHYSSIVVGSDQIWNVKAKDADDLYYLNLELSVPKSGYAISFGANNPFVLSKGAGYVNFVNSFVELTVRENNAKKWIEQNTMQKVDICLDPTLLLDEAEWEKKFDIQKPLIAGDYIFFYCFSIDSKVKQFLKKMSKLYRMPVYFMDPKEWCLKVCWSSGIKMVKEFGPVSYLNYVKYAKIFVTTSFHGTAFSVIFKKNFWYIDTGDNDPEKDDRALSLLGSLGLMSRYRTVEKLLETDLYVKPDYSDTVVRLCEMKEISMKHLSRIVEISNNG